MSVLAISNVQGSGNYPKICIENDKCTIVVFSVPSGVQMEEKAVVTDPTEEAKCWKWLGDLDTVNEEDAKSMISSQRLSMSKNHDCVWWWGVLTNLIYERWSEKKNELPLGANIIYVKYK